MQNILLKPNDPDQPEKPHRKTRWLQFWASLCLLIVVLISMLVGAMAARASMDKTKAVPTTPSVVSPPPLSDAVILSSFTRTVKSEGEEGYIHQTLVQYRQGIYCVSLHSGIGKSVSISCVPTPAMIE